jgi:hypothetical protein
MTLTASTVEALRELQTTIGENNEAKGFHGDRPERGDFVPGERGDRAFENAERFYQANLHMLIVSEAVEAHDEIRSGRAADETYYPTTIGLSAKPEGVPSEIAEGIIRGFDYFHRNNIDGAAIIVEKIIFNTSRPYKHGKKF